MASSPRRPAFDPRNYWDSLPRMAMLRVLQEEGTIEEIEHHKRRYRSELEKERLLKPKLQKSDYRVRKRIPEMEERIAHDLDSGWKSPETVVGPKTSSIFAAMLFKTLPTEVPQRPKIERRTFPKRPKGAQRVYSSRAGAGAKLNSNEVKSLRTRAWFNSLLTVMNFGIDSVYADGQTLMRSRSKFLRMSWIQARYPDQNNLIEKRFTAATIKRGTRFAALDLYKRHYENGSGRPSLKTLTDLDEVFPGTSVIFQVGFLGLPIWELLDGNQSACQQYLADVLPSFSQGTPDQWTQHILNLVLVEGAQQSIQPFVDANNYYGFNAWVGSALDRSIRPFDLKSASLSMALIAIYKIFDSAKLLPTKSIVWAISAFRRKGIYNDFFGPVVDDFINTEYLKGLPVFKI